MIKWLEGLPRKVNVEPSNVTRLLPLSTNLIFQSLGAKCFSLPLAIIVAKKGKIDLFEITITYIRENFRRVIKWNKKVISSVIWRKGESQSGGNKNTKHAKFSEKRTFFYPLARTRTCVYQGVKNVHFSGNLACFVFLKHPFWDSPFCLITDDIFVVYYEYRSLAKWFFKLSRSFNVCWLNVI